MYDAIINDFIFNPVRVTYIGCLGLFDNFPAQPVGDGYLVTGRHQSFLQGGGIVLFDQDRKGGPEQATPDAETDFYGPGGVEADKGLNPVSVFSHFRYKLIAGVTGGNASVVAVIPQLHEGFIFCQHLVENFAAFTE